MKAIYYDKFQSLPTIETLPDPSPSTDGVVLKVKATGLCRSDWHGWMGHDPDIELPHVPGHELAGEIVAVGKNIQNFKIGQRVTLPFVSGCGNCPDCWSGNHQVCGSQFQPGFTHWGSFAEYVAIEYADTNLVALPETIDDVTAASLGCRFATSFRAVVDQGKVSGGQWVAVHACGGVGLSAIMIANALGAKVVAIDIDDKKLNFARSIGAVATVNAKTSANVVQEVVEITKGGVDVSIDALGSPITMYHSIANLKKRGKHIQVGLLAPNQQNAPIPIAKIIAHELEIYGSHGMQAYRYPVMLEMIQEGKLKPHLLVEKTIGLEEAIGELIKMERFEGIGIKVIEMSII